MTPIIHQSFLTGTLNRLSYRGLLEATLYDKTLHISSPIREIIVPIETIQSVKLICNIIEFGVRVVYTDVSGTHIAAFRTRNYKRWGTAFHTIGVNVIPPRGWFSDLF